MKRKLMPDLFIKGTKVIIHIVSQCMRSITAFIIFQKQYAGVRNKNIRSINFWKQDVYTIWFELFMKFRIPPQLYKKLTTTFFSTTGPAYAIKQVKSDIKIFYTGENLQWNHYAAFKAYGMGHQVDLALGFDYMNNASYMRFPYWLTCFFPGNITTPDINRICQQLKFPITGPREHFACMVASHDMVGQRKKMMDRISDINVVASGGSFQNNTDELKIKFKNNKAAFLKQYNFNLCPENSNANGYVTEKIFEAIQAGCIPVYWGSNNQPELEILNQDAILFWKDNDNNDSLIRQMTFLSEHPNAMKEFMEQPRLLPNAGEYIRDILNELEIRITSILKKKSEIKSK